MRSALLFTLLCKCLAAQQAGIDGVAIDALTHRPMPGVHITLRPATAEGAGPEDVYGAISRADGHFSVAGMKPDVYSVAAQRNGYLLLSDPANSTATLKTGETLTDFVVQMTPHAVVIGHVLDEYGDPMQHVQVEVSPAGAGSPGAGALVAVNTDERGQFRLVLPPGRYYLEASANRFQMGNTPEIRGDGGAAPVYSATYYPATESKDQARAIDAAAGRELTGIDIRLVQKRSLKITGVVTGITDRSMPVSIAIFSTAENRRGIHSGLRFRGESIAASDGRFTVAGLSPGRYQLVADQGESLKSELADVQLENADESGVSLALHQGESLAGVVEMEGRPEKMTIRLESDFGTKSGDVGQDGAFHIDQVFPGTFRVKILPLPENAFVKSVKVDNSEAQGEKLDLSRGIFAAGIKVTVSRNGGQLEGSVLGSDGQPLQSPVAFVILVSTPDEIDKGNFKFVAAGTKFRYAGLRPGKYRLIAADGRNFAGEMENSEAIFANAPEIEIHEGDRIAKDVKVMDVENPGAAH